MNRRIIGCVFAAAALCVSSAVGQTWQQATEYDRLLIEYGLVATGNGIVVSQVEAPNATGNYVPDIASSVFAGKTFTFLSGPSGTSTHADGVARNFYGAQNVGTATSISMAPGVTSIFNYEAGDWITSVLNWVNVSGGNGPEPLAQNYVVQNHSWIGTAAAPSSLNATNMLQRVDYVINRDNVTMVVGVNNGNTNLPQLLSQAYNVISVGQNLAADHSDGPTTIYGAGRVKPEIVAFSGTATAQTSTSSSTARVSSAAAMLHELAVGTNASQSETMKAILMAGATKSEFPTWDRTTTRPLDEFFGAGELNIYNSYEILAGGEFNGSTAPPGSGVGDRGWDFGAANAGSPVFYNIDLTGTGGATDLSVLMTWNIDVNDTDPGSAFVPTTVLANMDLRLFDSSGSFLGLLVDESVSTVDNVEHIFATSIGPGLYTLQVSTNLTHDYAIAWRFDMSAIPEPGSLLILGLCGLWLASTRRRAR